MMMGQNVDSEKGQQVQLQTLTHTHTSLVVLKSCIM